VSFWQLASFFGPAPHLQSPLMQIETLEQFEPLPELAPELPEVPPDEPAPEEPEVPPDELLDVFSLLLLQPAAKTTMATATTETKAFEIFMVPRIRKRWSARYRPGCGPTPHRPSGQLATSTGALSARSSVAPTCTRA
jgi:hypothetical protein